jgi:uncharacterized protein (TIGR02452 family)
MNKKYLKEIAEDNADYVRNNRIPIPKTKEILYDKKMCIPIPINNNTDVTFEEMKTDECAIHYLKNNLSNNITIMNFASRHNPGGGYLYGARAQEEDLCRVIPELFYSLKKIKYPYGSDSVLITPNVVIRRNNENYILLKENLQYKINVVSCAAQNLKFEEFNENRIKRTLINMYFSVKNQIPDCDTLILGAWGCGAYRNDSYVIAKIMNDINKKYGGAYKRIVFSVPNGVNQQEFRETIELFKSSDN